MPETEQNIFDKLVPTEMTLGTITAAMATLESEADMLAFIQGYYLRLQGESDRYRIVVDNINNALDPHLANPKFNEDNTPKWKNALRAFRDTPRPSLS